jgi:hypothetical protein
VTDNSLSKRKLNQFLAEQQRAARLAQRQKPPVNGNGNGSTAKPASAPDLMDRAGESAVAQAAQVQPAGTTAAAVSTPMVASAAMLDPDASASEQSSYFGDEQTGTSPTARKALALTTGGARMEAPRNGNGNGNGTNAGSAAVLAAALSNGDSLPIPVSPAPASGCDFPPGDFPQVTPLQAIEPGSSLRVRSRSTQVLCLADASGVFIPRPLQAGVEQQFKGKAPWRLQAERIRDLEIVFQGAPLRQPGYVKDRMELLERS